MSCFGMRPSFPVPRHLGLAEVSETNGSQRFQTRRGGFTRSASDSNIPPETSASGGTPPPEDLGATKRRLVMIRRQPSFAPLALTVGFRSRTGWQPLCSSRHNQDSVVVMLPLPDPLSDYSVFAVLDGHGRAAHRVSAYVAQAIATHLRAGLVDAQAAATSSVPSALYRAVLKASADLHARSGFDVAMTGTTASVAVLHGLTLTCANVGDSRIVLATRDSGKLRAVALTNDHLPACAEERARVEQAGGRVDAWSPAGADTGPLRVWLKDRRLPGLAVTRAIGDSMLSGIVRPEPEVTTHEVVPGDSFVVVASDGIWCVMSNEEVVNFVDDRLAEQSCQAVTEDLVRHAAALWSEEDGGSVDDISAIIVEFNRP